MKKYLFIYFLLCNSVVSMGQSERVINPADMKQKTVVTEPLSLPKGFLRAGLFYFHSTLDKYFTTSGKKEYFPESSWGTSSGTQLWLQFGITDRFMVEAGIPRTNNLYNIHHKYFYPDLDTMFQYNASNRGKGFGDMVLSATWQIIPLSEKKLALKSSIDLTLPTGRKNFRNVVDINSYDAPTGEGAFCISPKITAKMLSYPYSFTAYATYTYNFRSSRVINPTDTKETDFKYGNTFISGISAGMQLNDWIVLTNEISFYSSGKGEVDGVSPNDLYNKLALSYVPGLVFQVRKFRLGESVTIPLKGKYFGADPQYVLMAQFVF